MAEHVSAGHRERVAANFDTVADGYDNSEALFSGPLAARLIDAAALVPGEHVLDAGCGTGAVTIPAARAVGPTGRVTGIDLSGKMLDRAAARLAGLSPAGRAPFRLARADAERPPFRAGSFDVVLASLLMFLLADPAQAVRRHRALLRPGGRLVFTWNAGEDPRWLPVFAAVESRIPPATPAVGELLHRWPFTSVADVETMLSGAGYTSIATTTSQLGIRYEDPGQWWQSAWSRARRLAWQHIPVAERPAAREEAFALLEPIREPGGAVIRAPRFACTSALRPRR
jgi:ubiquinone/menaquinone biosynthesis C-methylase UbiE